jgi:hypothetical protein
MADMTTLPKFNSEAEEAQWWADHQDDLADKFEAAAANGTLGRGTVAKRAERIVCAQSKAPEGWWCTRTLDHDGPCAAIPYQKD